MIIQAPAIPVMIKPNRVRGLNFCLFRFEGFMGKNEENTK
jgi:hypothetical protein